MTTISDSDIENFVENLTLKMFHVGADDVNYKILKMVPTNTRYVMASVNLTKMPVNARLNSLEEVGLIKRKKGSGQIVQTEYTQYFLDLLSLIKAKVTDSVKSQLSDL